MKRARAKNVHPAAGLAAVAVVVVVVAAAEIAAVVAVAVAVAVIARAAKIVAGNRWLQTAVTRRFFHINFPGFRMPLGSSASFTV